MQTPYVFISSHPRLNVSGLTQIRTLLVPSSQHSIVFAPSKSFPDLVLASSMTAVDNFGRCDECDNGITAIETIFLDGVCRCRHATRRPFNSVEAHSRIQTANDPVDFETQFSSYCSNKMIFDSLSFPLVYFNFNVDSFFGF